MMETIQIAKSKAMSTQKVNRMIFFFGVLATPSFRFDVNTASLNIEIKGGIPNI